MKLKDFFMKIATRLHSAVYIASGGRIAGAIGSAPVLLLITTGRRTGKARTTPLLYLEQETCEVIVASYGGDDRMPVWYLNLTATPDVTIRKGSHELRRRARTATGAERAELWPKTVALYPGYATYQARTKREIPLVILEPI
jgi:F420H(2)-dependent quinone reductase